MQGRRKLKLIMNKDAYYNQRYYNCISKVTKK